MDYFYSINPFIFVLMSGVIPIKVYKDLSNPENLKYDLYRKGGVYGFINIKDKITLNST